MRHREQEYAKFLEACRPPAKPSVAEAPAAGEQLVEKAIQLDYKAINAYAFSPDRKRALTGSSDNTVRLWDVETGRCLRVFEGHTGPLFGVAWSADGRRALSCSHDKTVRLWDVETGRCLRVFAGHMSPVQSVAWSADQRRAVYGASDNTIGCGTCRRGAACRCSKATQRASKTVMWSADQRRAFSGDQRGGIRVWDLSEFVTEARTQEASAPALPPAPDHIQYTNAKVLLVGKSGAGKTGLSKVLAGEKWQPSDSTVGAWATQWKLPVSSGDGVEREIWLWDFGGQADQRLIRQLYMDETALAVLVFDGQKEDLFETLGQWDRDLTRTSRNPFSKLLVAGRVDAGGLRVSRSQIEAFKKERGYLDLLETSAKTGLRCEELKRAILEGIRWEQSFPVLLVIRTSDGEARWMEIRDYLKRESDNGKKPVKQIVFEGERFDVMSVRRWREKALAERYRITKGK